MLSKGVHTSPSSDHETIKELLTFACTAKPILPHKEENGKDYPVGNERRPHDEMGEALAKVVTAAESLRNNPAKQHLNPGDEGHSFAEDSMSGDDGFTDPGVDALGQVESKVDPK